MNLQTVDTAALAAPPRKVTTLPPFLRIKDACEAFGCSQETLYSLTAGGHIRMSKLAGRTLVDTQSVLDHLAANTARIHRTPRRRKEAA